MRTEYDVIVVGGGMAGLTATAYLLKEKKNVLLIEKDEHLGGLVGAFKVNGFTLDKGARGIIDSGIVFPMLKQLGLSLEFVDNPIEMRVENETVTLSRKDDLEAYRLMLKKLYPDHTKDVDRILEEIYKVMGYMDVLYGIENPLFLPKPYSMDYLKNTLLPWMLKFLPNILKAEKMMEPIEKHLDKITSSSALRHIIAQHFFEDTPSFFGLSYFTLYLQYHYPKGSTQALVDALVNSFDETYLTIKTSLEVTEIDPITRSITLNHEVFTAKELLWAADINTLYQRISPDHLKPKELKNLRDKQKTYASLKGADSVLSNYFMVDLDPKEVEKYFGCHVFYTPSKEGLSKLSLNDIRTHSGFVSDEGQLFEWMEKMLRHTTYEISIPVLRDPSLAPIGKSALIVSFLMDYGLTQHFKDLGLYGKLKAFVEEQVYEILSEKAPVLKDRLIQTITSTPLTIQQRTNAHEGSLSGYSFKNKPFPVQYKFLSVSKSVFTSFKHIKQAGQFAFNPAGVPVAILTGKLAADQILKDLQKWKD